MKLQWLRRTTARRATGPSATTEIEPKAPVASTGSYGEIEDGRIKHLELIQDVVSRLGNNGFVIKGWSLTLAAAIFGFAVQSKNPAIALVAVPTTLLFWLMDAHILRAERLYRWLYGRVAASDPAIRVFFMGATEPGFAEKAPASIASWWVTLRRPALLFLYSLVLVAAALVAASVWVGNQPQPNCAASTAPVGPSSLHAQGASDPLSKVDWTERASTS